MVYAWSERRLMVAGAALLWLAGSTCPALALAGGPGFWEAVRRPALVRYRALIRQAEAAMDEHAWARAAELSERAAALVDDRPEAHLLLGRASLSLHEPTTARKAFGAALGASATALDDPTLAQVAAHAAMLAGDCAFAARVLQRAVGLLDAGRERRQLFTRLGDALLCAGPASLAAALRAYRHALRGSHDPEDQSLPLRLGMALALRRAGEREQARRALSGLSMPERLERSLQNHLLPEPERLARIATGLEAIGDQAGALQAWRDAASLGGPWHAFHSTQASVLPDTGGGSP